MKSTYNEILQNMKAAYNKEIGREIAENSIDEKKLEAIASELYGLSCYGDFILKQAFVQTATGGYLDRHGALRDCKRKLGTKAKGTLTFGINEAIASDIVIEKGTVCSKPNYPLIQYSTDDEIGDHWYLISEDQTPVEGYELSTKQYLVKVNVAKELQGSDTVYSKTVTYYAVPEDIGNSLPDEDSLTALSGQSGFIFDRYCAADRNIL